MKIKATMHRRYARSASLLAAFAPAVLLIPVHAAAPGVVMLKYKFTPGEALRYKYTSDIVGTGAVGGARAPTASYMTADYTQTVESVDPATGYATLRLTLTHPTMTLAMNSKTKPIVLPVSALSHTTIVMSPSGKPIPTKLGDAAAGTLVEMLLSDMFAGGAPMDKYSTLPNHPVRVGDAWGYDVKPSNAPGGELSLKQSLISVSSAGGHLVADIASRYLNTLNMLPATESQPLHVTGSQNSDGCEQLDLTDGTIKSMAMMMRLNRSAKPLFGIAVPTSAYNAHIIMTISMQRVGS